MSNFLHGVTVTEVNDGVRPIQTSSSSVIGIIGTAPEAQNFPLNTPTLITGSYTEAAKLGKTGTLPSAVNAILAQTGAVIVVVRVAEATKDESQTVPDHDSEDEGATKTITVQVLDAESTKTNIIGKVEKDGSYLGTYSFLASKSKLGVSPRILLAPGFSTKDVVAELIKIAERLRAVVIADTPTDSDENLMQFVTDCASARVYAVYPQVINTKNEIEPTSPYVAGVIAKNDNDNGFWCSPSNKTINGIVGLSKPVDFSLGDSACRANYLNEKNIATIINQDGYRLWGNRSTVNDGQYKFLCVRRTADIISDSILQAHLWAVDRNIVKNYLTDVVESVNAFLSDLRAQGAILAGKCYANKELNTAANIANGQVYFDFEFTPAYPAEQVTFRAYLNNENIEEVLLQNLAEA
ncbi:MAG: phage tail sheath subtilisin-like domain-containing protein [Alphaproteobacteria bacterium]|nr:phage tail sheath subtilisin-like domain-containing protein [Alphaproteobacteria bacterium]